MGRLVPGSADSSSAFGHRSVDPQGCRYLLSSEVMRISELGGLGSLLGSVLGACFLVVLPELLAGLDVWQALVYGLIMVVTIIFMPFGLSGALQRYAHRWFGIGVEPMIPRRLGH